MGDWDNIIQTGITRVTWVTGITRMTMVTWVTGITRMTRVTRLTIRKA